MSPHSKIKLSLISALVVGLSLISYTAKAANYTWTGAVSTSWSQSANWSPAGVPGAQDSAVVGTNKTVDVPSSVTVNALSIDSGSKLTGSGNLTVTGVLGLKGAALSGSGIVNIPAGAILNFDGGSTDGGLVGGLLGTVGNIVDNLLNVLIGKKIYNSGTANVNSGNIDLGTDFYNYAGGVFNLKTDAAIRPVGLIASAFKNSGTFTKSAGSGVTEVAVSFENAGTLDARSGTVKFSSGYKQTAGSTQLNGGSIAALALIDLQNGSLQGTGVIQGAVRSNGNVKPGHSPGAITINGNYTQTASGTLDMEIGGTIGGSQYDQLIVNGTATLDGTLNIIGYNGFLPAEGNNFQLLNSYSQVGKFAKINGQYPGSQRFYSVAYTSTYVVATGHVDSTAPTISITAPINNAYVSNLDSIAGTIAENSNGSGISTVTLELKRTSDSRYWNGLSWVTTATPLATLLTSNNWSRTHSSSMPMPRDANLPSGSYLINVTSYDLAGNVSRASATANIDLIAPTLKVTAPANNADYKSLTSATGSTSDTGSGVFQVTVSLYRYATAGAPAGYWAGGTTWTSTYGSANERAATVSQTTWSLTLPTMVNAPYSLRATARDKAGNIAVLPNVFFTKSGGTSSVIASAAVATAASNSVEINFTGALDAVAATDSWHYTITKGSSAVTVLGASYSATANKVVLTVPTGSLRTGDSITVAWSTLFDTQGKKLSGQVGPLSVR